MGTNYYRIPTEDEMRERKNEPIKKITNIKISPRMILNKFEEKQEDFNSRSVWDEFISDTKIHLGKRSMGWKFVWNFHGNRYYTNKEELFDFIRRGRVINEYGELIPNEEFIDGALNWCQPNGCVYNEEYLRSHPRERTVFSSPEYYSKIIDGLVVSPSEFFS